MRGPEQIPNDMLRQMNKFESVGTAAPLALVESQTGRSNPSFNPDASEIRSLRPVPTREELGFRRKPELKNRGETPTTKQAPRTGKSSENTQVSEAQESPEAKTIKPRPTRTAQSQSPSAKAIRETTTTDNDSSSGDVMHRVAFAGETLRIISQWYTGDVGNTGRIARINGIEKPDELAINQAIRIPRYLLRTTEPLPQTEIPLIPKAVTPEAGPKRASTSSSRAVTPENKESQISHTDLSHTDLSHTELGQTGISQTEKSSQEDQPIDLPPRPQTIYLDDSLAEDSPVAEERSPSPSSLH